MIILITNINDILRNITMRDCIGMYCLTFMRQHVSKVYKY